MTLICNDPNEKPQGVVIKESGPKVIKFLVNELDPDQNEITHDTVHAIEFMLMPFTSVKIAAAQRHGRGLQDLPIHFWISKTPYGMAIPENWKNLNIISLLSDPTLIYMSETSASPRPKDPSLIVMPTGTYYINIHNRHGASSYYQANVVLYSKQIKTC